MKKRLLCNGPATEVEGVNADELELDNEDDDVALFVVTPLGLVGLPSFFPVS